MQQVDVAILAVKLKAQQQKQQQQYIVTTIFKSLKLVRSALFV